MFKKLLLLLVMIDICGFYLAFKSLTAELPWFTARKTQTTVETEQLSHDTICFVPEETLPFAFMPGETRLLVRESSVVQIFDHGTGALDSIIHASKNVITATLSPDGRYLAYSDVDDGNQVVLASPDGELLIRTIDRMQGPVWELFFSPDASLLAATDGIEIRIWRVEDGKLLYIGKAACS